MPQPLSKVHPDIGFELATGNTPHPPEMARAIFAVINLWAQIEHTYSSLLAGIARADPVTVTAVYQAMVNGDARRASVLAAAKASLAPEPVSMIEAVMSASKASREQRNEFAHHLWGTLNGRDDCVILMRPKEAALWEASHSAWAHNMGLATTPPPALDRSQIFVWNQRDFDEAEELARLRHSQTARLPFLINHPASERMRLKLLEDPKIARLYERYLRENMR